MSHLWGNYLLSFLLSYGLGFWSIQEDWEIYSSNSYSYWWLFLTISCLSSLCYFSPFARCSCYLHTNADKWNDHRPPLWIFRSALVCYYWTNLLSLSLSSICESPDHVLNWKSPIFVARFLLLPHVMQWGISYFH